MELSPIFDLPFWSAFLIFILFSFIGWASEVVYVGVISARKFVNRGFLHGPVCPVYGFGGVVILTLPSELYATWIPLFFASMILCTVVEYFVSWLMEKLFHARWWDYSHYKFQLNGRICLLNSVLFGFLGVAVIHFVYPLIIDFLNDLGKTVVTASGKAIFAVLIIDAAFTVRKLIDFAKIMQRIKDFDETLNTRYGQEEWFKKGSLTETLESVKEQAELKAETFNQKILDSLEKLQNFQYPAVESFLKKFPSIKTAHHKEDLRKLKEAAKNHFKKIKI